MVAKLGKLFNLKHIPKISLIECNLETGRTHQIRVHAKHIECPIVGDNLYKLRRKEDVDVKKTISPLLDSKRMRQMLHAHELSIVHPESSKTLFFGFAESLLANTHPADPAPIIT